MGDAIERAYQPPASDADADATAPQGEPPVTSLRLVRLHLLVLAVTLASLVITTTLMQLELLDPAPGLLTPEGYNRAFTIHGVAGVTSFVVVLLGVLPMLVLPSLLGIRYPAWVAWATLITWGACAVPWWAWLDDPFATPSRLVLQRLPVLATWCLPGVGLVLAVLGGGRAAFARAPVLGLGLVLGGAGIVAFLVLTVIVPLLGLPSVPAPTFADPASSVLVVVTAGLVEQHRGVSLTSRRFTVAFAAMLVGAWATYGARLVADPEQADLVTRLGNLVLIPALLFLVVHLVRRISVGSPDPVGVAVTLALLSLTGATLLWRVLGRLANDVHLHDTYFVLAPLHLAGAAVLLLLVAACFHAAVPLFGRSPRRGVGIVGVLALGGGMGLAFATMALVGQEGMPRRYFTYVPQFEGRFEQLGLGGLVTGVGLVLVVAAIATGPRRVKAPTSSIEPVGS